jgi:hypothetical protein
MIKLCKTGAKLAEKISYVVDMVNKGGNKLIPSSFCKCVKMLKIRL